MAIVVVRLQNSHLGQNEVHRGHANLNVVDRFPETQIPFPINVKAAVARPRNIRSVVG